MAVSFRLSGGASNSNQAASLGGAISANAVPASLFGSIPQSQFTTGITKYRLIYVSTSLALSSLKVYKSETPSPATTVSFGWAVAAANQNEAAIANETTAPAGVTFSNASDLAAAPDAGALAAGQYRGLWIRYVINAGTAVIPLEGFSLSFAPVETGGSTGYTANPNHFNRKMGWANTQGHLSGPGGTYTILKVTNRNASGAGSLKAAIDATGARLVVFEVSGNIDLAGTDLIITNPYITIAGQTAPSPGITIIKGQLLTRTNNIICQHVKVRPGTGAGTDKDGVETQPGSVDVYFGHCSFSWGSDGNIDIAGFNLTGTDPAVWRANTSHRVTMDRCLITEDLVGGVDSASGATLFEDNVSYVLAHGCAWINNHTRCPLFKGGTWGALINNLIYNSQDKFVDQTLQNAAWSGKVKQEAKVDAINNYAKAGPMTSSAVAFFEVVSNYGATYYGSGNICLRTNGTSYPETHITANTQPYNTGGYLTIVGAPQLTGHGITPIAASAVPAMILASVGARPWERDTIDQRALNDFQAGTGSYIASESAVGGYPASVNNTRTFNPAHWNLTNMEPIHADALQLVAQYPTQVSVPASQYPAISISQPAYLTPVAFGSLETKVIRVSNANGIRHLYATQSAFNADGTLLLLCENFSGGPYRLLSTSNWSVAQSGIDKGFQFNFFDPVNPNIIWGADGEGGGNRIYKYDLQANVVTTYPIPGGYTGIILGGGEGSISNGGRYIAAVGQKGDGNTYAFVFDTLLGTVEGTITLTGWTGPGGDLDNFHISQSGNFLVIASYRAGSAGHRIYDAVTLALLRTYGGGGASPFPGHMDLGFRADGDECMVRLDQNGALVTVRLSDGNARVEVPANAMSWANHVSCRNIGRPGYAYVSMFYQADQASKYLYREIVAVKLDGTGTIERFGQAVFPNSANYSTQAHACPSPDGRRVAFASGWGTTTEREYVCGMGI